MSLSVEFFVQLAYALGIGVLIGLERALGQVGSSASATEPEVPLDPAPSAEPVAVEGETLGVRTFAILSLVGFALALAADQYAFVAPVGLLAVAALVVAMYRAASDHGVGITTEVAAFGTCILGMLCHFEPRAAGVVALIITVILASKRFTWTVVRKMRRVELTDTLKFLIVILIVLPMLPAEPLDPYGAFNPYKVGLLVVLVSGISFSGYFLMRILGPQRGLGLTGLVGGLTSSTAVTAAMAQQARQNPGLGAICAFATVAANATMFVRVLVVVAILDVALALRLAWVIGAMAIVAAVAAAILWRRATVRHPTQDDANAVKLKNPFSIGPALKFGAFFVVILFVAKLAKAWFGARGIYAAAALSGLADVDAITLSLVEQTVADELAASVAAIGITIAVVSNSVVKSIIATYAGGWSFGRTVGLCLGLATGAGLIVAFAIP